LTIGDIAAADEDIRRAGQLAEFMHAPIIDFESASVEGFRAQIEGRFDVAQKAIDRLANAPWPIAAPHRDFFRRLRTLVMQDERGDLSQEADQGYLERVPSNLVRVYHFTKTSADAIACRMLLASGRRELSFSTFQAIVGRSLDAIPHDDFYLVTLCDLAVVCCEFGDRERAADLYDRLRPYAALCAVEIPLHYRGPVAHFLGLLARALGREATAIEHFEGAIAVSARVGARPMLNRTRLELAAILMRRTDAASRARAAFLVEEGLASAGEIGMSRVCAAFEELRRGIAAAPPPVQSAVQAHEPA
jgi:hypothetical protein